MDTAGTAKPPRSTALRRRLIRAGKWMGAVVIALIVALCAATAFCSVFLRLPDGRSMLIGGAGLEFRTSTLYVNLRELAQGIDPARDWHVRASAQRETFVWWPRWHTDGRSQFTAYPLWPNGKSGRPIGGKGWDVQVPLWLPLVLVAIPTAALFYLDRPTARRRRIGLCPGCGYDRAGLAPASSCPECNASPPPGATPAQ